MYKKFLLKCDVNNHYKGWWEDTEFYFDTKEEMICAIKNGINEIKPRGKGKFEAQYNHENLGIFDTVEEAAITHDKKKKEVIIEIANEYKNQIPDKVYQALINWIPDYIDYSEYE